MRYINLYNLFPTYFPVKHLKSFLLIIALVIPTMVCHAIGTQEIADSLKVRLAVAKTQSDSLRLLYDIFDASDQGRKEPVGWELLDLAVRMNHQVALIDMVPQMASLTRKQLKNDRKLLYYASNIEDRDHRKACELFVHVQRAMDEASYIPEEDLRDAILRYAKEDMTPKNDLFEDILDLYRMVVFVGAGARGNLYLEYLNRLEKMISRLPPDCYYIRNLFYTTSAICHSQNGNYRKAIEADQALIDVISHLEERYHSMGRTYRNYDRYYYICYRRMLSNYKGLTKEEIKDYYAKCALLAEENREVADDFYGEGRPTIYRLMAEKDYAALVPRLKKAIQMMKDKSTANSNIYRDLLGMLVIASDSIGDSATTLTALKEYNMELEQQLKSNSEEAYRELQTRYDVETLKAERNESEMLRRDSELMAGQKVITVALVALLIFVILLMVIYRKNFTLKQRVRDLKKETTQLHKTVERLLHDGKPAGTVEVKGLRSTSPDDKR